MKIAPFTLSTLALAASVATAQPSMHSTHSVQPLGNNQACAAISPQAAQINMGGQTCASALSGYIDRFNTGKFQINRGCPAGTTLSGFSNITCQDIIQPNGHPQANFKGQGCCVAPHGGLHAQMPMPLPMAPPLANANGFGHDNHPLNAGSGQNRTVMRHHGAATPTLSDFNASYQTNYVGAHYQNPADTQLFMETLPLKCPAHSRPTHARLTLQLTKAHAMNAPGLIGFWENGQAWLNSSIWTNAEPLGTNKTVVFDLSTVPSVGHFIAPGVKITHNAVLGNANSLVYDRDLSFSVSKHTMVRQATLSFQCSARR